MTDITTILEQITQRLLLYRKTIHQAGALTNPEDQLLERALKRVEDKLFLIDGVANDATIQTLLNDARQIITTYQDLPMAKMKGLDPTAITQLPNLERIAPQIPAWKQRYDAANPTQRRALEVYETVLTGIHTEALRVVELVNGNRLNANSQAEFAKVMSANDKRKDYIEEELNDLLAIPEEERKERHKRAIIEYQTQLDVINAYEADLFSFIENNPVRIDRVDRIEDMNGNAIEGVNGQAFYDHNTNEFVLELDEGGKPSLGAHELLHLVQSRQGKLVFLRGTKNSVGFLGDVYDEIEAYRIQYSIDASSIPGSPSSIEGITPDFVRHLNAAYNNLPDRRYGINDTLDTLNAHPQYNGILRNLFGEGKIINPTTNAVELTWDYYHTWTFVDFCNDRLLDHGTRTNADYMGFIFVH